MDLVLINARLHLLVFLYMFDLFHHLDLKFLCFNLISIIFQINQPKIMVIIHFYFQKLYIHYLEKAYFLQSLKIYDFNFTICYSFLDENQS
jgi:hypothetical protein